MHSAEESTALLFEAIFIVFAAAIFGGIGLVAATGALDACSYLGIHEDGEIRLQAVAQDTMQRQHRFTAQLAASTLIRFRGVGETVAEHDLAIGQCWLDHFCDVLGARSKHQSQFRHGRETGGGGVEQQPADFLSGSGPARLAGHHDR